MSEQLIPTPGIFGENGNFLLERELGSGGMGGVYLGRDKMLDRPVAVKVMLRELGSDAVFVEKFKKEAQAAARLIHPNIVQIYSYGICDGMPYMAMELASGGSLDSVMNANPGHADITRVMKICQQTALALQCASDQGFVHGDVKPENILLDANGNAKLVDFGLAAMQSDTDEIWGTPYYISPEKVRKEVVDFRADMYSLGGTLYHALTGVAPFEGEDSIAVVKKRLEGAPRKPSEIRPEITPAIDKLVMKMLAMNKEDRYPSFEALQEAFKKVLASGLASSTDTKSVEPLKSTTKSLGVRRKPMRTRIVMKTKTSGLSTTGSTKITFPTKAGTGSLTAPQPVDAAAEEDDSNGGNLALKVVLCVVGGLLVIGGIIGGLFWFKASSAASRKAEVAAQVRGAFTLAQTSIADTVQKANDFAAEYERLASLALEECKKPTDELAKLLPPAAVARLKPQPAAEKKAAEPVAPQKAPASAPAQKPASAQSNSPKNDKTNVIASSASVSLSMTNVPTGSAGAAQSPAPVKATPPKPAVKVPDVLENNDALQQIIVTMNDLWERAYGCQASAKNIRDMARQIVQKAAEADALKDMTHENMEVMAGISRVVVERLEQMRGSKDVEDIKKSLNYIRSKGEKTVSQAANRLKIEKLERERKAKAEAAAAAEKKLLQEKEEKRKARIQEECDAATAKFDAIVAQGNLRQLDWKGAVRQIEATKSEFETAEGQLKADLQIRKVEAMRKMQEIFIKSMKGHKFRGKLRDAVVTDVNERDITILKADGKTKNSIIWQKFVKEYPGNLNELINTYVLNGRKLAKPPLSLIEWAEAMTGSALMMQLVCSDVNGAVERSEVLAKETVKQFPDYAKVLREIFPAIKFEVPEE